MKQPKYALNETIYAIVDNSIKQGEIVKRTISDGFNREGNPYDAINYVVRFNKTTKEGERSFHQSFYENQLFPTKDQLVDSLE